MASSKGSIRIATTDESKWDADSHSGQLIDESLDFYGIKSRQDARDLVRRARAVTDLAQHAIVLAPVSTPAAPLAPDPGGQLLWELLAARADLVLITGDKLLLRAAGMRGRVISPRAFVSGTDRGNNAP